jgi:cyclopropane-fatty-acyl-phospholipid synthase
MALKAAVAAAALAVGVSRAGMMPPQVTSMIAELTDTYAPLAFDAFERNEIPDVITRFGIRNLLAARLEEERQPDNFAQQQRLMAFVDELKNSPIAVNTADANEQHYEVPARFYELVLGNFSKYSSALYPPNTAAADASKLLDEAEDRMLAL